MKHIGVLLPDTNTVVEHDLMRLACEDAEILTDVTFHFSRIATQADYGQDEAQFLQQVCSNSRGAASLFREIPLDATGFFCTSAILVCPNMFGFGSCIDPLTAIQVVSSEYGPKDVLLMSPYTPSTAYILEEHMRAIGIPVSANIHLGLRYSIDRYDLNRAKAAISENMHAGVDLVIISCTNFRALELIEFVESKFGIPCISSNQAMFKAICDAIGVATHRITRYGRIFRR